MVTEHSRLDQHSVSDRAAEQLLEVVPRLMRLISSEAQASDPGAALTVTQLRTLALLKRKQRLPSELARDLRITAATASEIADLLVRRGLVERRDEPEDRRLSPLRITPDGLTRLEAARQRAIGGLRSLLTRLSPAEVAALERGLGPLLEALRSGAAVSDEDADGR